MVILPFSVFDFYNKHETCNSQFIRTPIPIYGQETDWCQDFWEALRLFDLFWMLVTHRQYNLIWNGREVTSDSYSCLFIAVGNCFDGNTIVMSGNREIIVVRSIILLYNVGFIPLLTCRPHYTSLNC